MRLDCCRSANGGGMWMFCRTSTRRSGSQRIEADEFYSEEEVDALLAVASEWQPLFLVGFRTGLRIGEIVGLRWSDVDLAAKQVVIRQAFQRRDGQDLMQTTKSGRVRPVPLTRDTVAALEALPRSAGLVFPGENGQPLSTRVVTRAGQRIAKKAGITKHFHLHMMRHSFTSHALMSGVPTRTVQAWGGWASLSMLERYSHFVPQHHQNQIDKLAPPRPSAIAEVAI